MSEYRYGRGSNGLDGHDDRDRRGALRGDERDGDSRRGGRDDRDYRDRRDRDVRAGWPERERDKDVRRSRRSRSPSHSRDRSLSPSYERRRDERKRKRVTGWDVPPTAEQAAAEAAAALTSASGIAPSIAPLLPSGPPTSGSIHPSRLGLVPTSSLPTPSFGSPPTNPALQRQARRLYIGNLPLPITEHELRSLFNTAFPAAFPNQPPGDAVLSVYLNVEKKFGFVEFRTPDEATMALQLDGIVLRGISLRVKRPADYVPPASAMTAAPPSGINSAFMGGMYSGYQSSAGAAVPAPNLSSLPHFFPPRLPGQVSDQVPDGPHKLFCGGLPYSLPETDIMELLKAYGDLRGFHLVRDKETGQSKGYAFFEYLDPSVTDSAVQGLHGIPIGERTLTVRRAQAKSMGGPGGGGGLADFSMIPALSGVFGMPTPVLVMSNMVAEDETADEQEYRDIVDDIRTEMGKYGRVLSVLVPRRGERGVGQVYVEYDTAADAMKARQEVEGRSFASRTVRCGFLDIDKYRRREL